ncbi:MAG: DUF2625 family protein, partial [Hymenobacter sp.]
MFCCFTARLFLLLFGLVFICSSKPVAAQQMVQRELSELINTQDPGWPIVAGWIKQSKNEVQVLPKIPSRADSALLAAQV